MEGRARDLRRCLWLIPAALLGIVACGEREAPPPAAQPALTPAPAESAAVRPDTLKGDSVMARDTLAPSSP